MAQKKILIAASASIPLQAIQYYFPEIPETWEGKDIVVLDGNMALRREIADRWPNAVFLAAKTRSSIRKLLEKTSHLILMWDGEDLTKFLFEARLLAVPVKVIPVQITRVVNKKLTDEYDVYIGRGSIWGNPFAIGHGDGPDREEVIEKFKEYFNEKLKSDPDFKRGLFGLRGLRLACFCKPEACHGDVIAAYLDRFPNPDEDG